MRVPPKPVSWFLVLVVVLVLVLNLNLNGLNKLYPLVEHFFSLRYEPDSGPLSSEYLGYEYEHDDENETDEEIPTHQ